MGYVRNQFVDLFTTLIGYIGREGPQKSLNCHKSTLSGRMEGCFLSFCLRCERSVRRLVLIAIMYYCPCEWRRNSLYYVCYEWCESEVIIVNLRLNRPD